MPTKEEKAELMKVKPPRDVVAQIKDFEQTSGMDHEKVKRAFYKALALPSLDAYKDNDERCRQAMVIMVAMHKSKMPSDNVVLFPMEFFVFAKTPVSTIMRKVEKTDPITGTKVVTGEEVPLGKVYGVFEGIPSNDTDAPKLPAQFGVLTLWGDACKFLDDVKKGNAYTSSFSVKRVEEDNHYELSLNNYVKAVPLTGKTFPTAKEIIEKYSMPFPVSHAAHHMGDRKVIHGRIIRAFTRLGKGNNKLMGYTILIDANADVDTIRAGGRNTGKELSVLWSASDMASEYPAMTECYVMAKIGQGNSQFGGLSVFGDFIVPLVVADEGMDKIFDDDEDEDTYNVTSNGSDEAPSPIPSDVIANAPATGAPVMSAAKESTGGADEVPGTAELDGW